MPRDPRPIGPVDTRHPEYQQLKQRLHRDVLDRLNLQRLTRASRADAEPQVRAVASAILDGEGRAPLTVAERESLVDDLLDELFALGPIEALLRDPDVSDVLVNRYDQVWVERDGQLVPTDVVFRDDAHLMSIIDRIVSSVGRRIDESSPIVDARLADGSRVNAIIPPLALDGPSLSIRRFPMKRLTADDLLQRATLTAPMLDFLRSAVAARLNIVVAGGTGAGKTTLLNVLSSFISDRERIITIEDAAELRLQQRHVVRLETRPANVEGKGAVHQRQLVMNALRMRPDRIVVGEVRGDEAIDMLQAMNTGHDGSLSTIHANTPRDALERLATMVAMANLSMSDAVVRQQITAAIDLVIQVVRLSDGTRKISHISELTGMDNGAMVMQDLYVFERHGVTPFGRVAGEFRTLPVRPRCGDRIERYTAVA